MCEAAFKTPVQELKMAEVKNRIFIKRDDLLGFSFGGNKVRIAWEFYLDMKDKGCNCMVAYGSNRSNMCRALANMAAKYGFRCYILTPWEDVVEEGTFNSRMVEMFGAEVRYCHKNNVSEGVSSLMEELREKGDIPYYIFGDCYGQGNEDTAARAYREVYKDILEEQNRLGLDFDYIYLASGTGMTQGGLISGQKKYGGNGKIVGISVARPLERGRSEVARFADASPEEVYFTDKYTCGGYGCYDQSVETVIKQMMGQYGIPLDPTYTGKAFCGMLECLKQEKQSSSKVLFLHTGGTPLYFDYLNDLNKKGQ